MRFFLALLLFYCVSQAVAAPKEELNKVQADLGQQQEIQKQLARQERDAQTKLDGLRRELIAASRDVRLRERALLKVQSRLDKTKAEMKMAQEKLDTERESLAQLVLALQRLDRMPPQALLARPSAPIDTARSFYLLQHVMPVLSSRAKQVKTTLDDLVGLQDTLIAQQDDLAAEGRSLKEKQDRLQAGLDERAALLKDTRQSREQAEKKVASLAKQARDLRDLMARLSKIEHKPAPAVKKTITSLGQSLRSWLGGKSALPVEGRIVTGYGQAMAGGGKSQGVSIAAAPGAIVTAPGNGTVRFAGPFRQYKLLVIIQHENGDHSLLGGMQEVYTETGEQVASGEPLGKLPAKKINGDSAQQASLYYERRHNGKPIDPRSARG